MFVAEILRVIENPNLAFNRIAHRFEPSRELDPEKIITVHYKNALHTVPSLEFEARELGKKNVSKNWKLQQIKLNGQI